MTVVGARTVEKAWKQLQAMGGSGGEARARELGEARPELVAYVLATTRELSPAARRVAWQGLELASVTLRATSLPRVPLGELMAAEARNHQLALELELAHPRIADRFLQHGAGLRQRALLNRLAAEAARAPEGERGAVFLVVKTLVDVLDRSSR